MPLYDITLKYYILCHMYIDSCIGNTHLRISVELVFIYIYIYINLSTSNALLQIFMKNLYNIFMYIYVYMYCKNHSVDVSSQNFWKFKTSRKF